MAKHLDHDDAMELAVQLTCSYLSTSHSGSTDAEDLILDYYRQLRNVEKRLREEYALVEEGAEAEELQLA
jgi:hypothetical protein